MRPGTVSFPPVLPVLALALLWLLGGCTGKSSESREEKQRQARKVAEVNTQLGREYMSRGQYEIALDKLKKAVKADDDYAPAHTMMAVLYETIGENEDAAEHYLAAYKAAPNNGDVNNNYGAFLCRNGEGRKALRYFDQALEDPFYRTPAVAMSNAGSCALDLGDEQGAEDRLRRALEFDPDFADALYSMAALKAGAGDYLRARAFLQRYEATGALSAQGLLLGFEVEEALGNGQGATAYRKRLLKSFPNSAEAKELIDAGGRAP
jgi:type IV pilus assembly protein PilF